ncbi:uncharacterized protein LACBIDRAFT_329208 [Laccaria bicolor S238N-H82]|uniref:Predicted protein n=1 Tax=Laccaria bicolor (strain S238N-H82 / ATCC MYA-4686) TaxID=486041 RepID=B0DHD6_LACBS|nr:uncharacterized protein LACBIDRAFT_329208 [Laccaria bicolor S238N-H82]EDR05998.1 predicted protein [Laccaria bicolor S238N-H82]|eukprot:XP_001883286.1 predicted protein [Laccaria bicolor S238N-H82]
MLQGYNTLSKIPQNFWEYAAQYDVEATSMENTQGRHSDLAGAQACSGFERSLLGSTEAITSTKPSTQAPLIPTRSTTNFQVHINAIEGIIPSLYCCDDTLWRGGVLYLKLGYGHERKYPHTSVPLTFVVTHFSADIVNPTRLLSFCIWQDDFVTGAKSEALHTLHCAKFKLIMTN